MEGDASVGKQVGVAAGAGHVNVALSGVDVGHVDTDNNLLVGVLVAVALQLGRVHVVGSDGRNDRANGMELDERGLGGALERQGLVTLEHFKDGCKLAGRHALGSKVGRLAADLEGAGALELHRQRRGAEDNVVGSGDGNGVAARVWGGR